MSTLRKEDMGVADELVESGQRFMVGGRRFVAGVALAEIEWLGTTKAVRVIVSEDTLLGTELLDGAMLVIDYVAHTLTISGEENR